MRRVSVSVLTVATLLGALAIQTSAFAETRLPGRRAGLATQAQKPAGVPAGSADASLPPPSFDGSTGGPDGGADANADDDPPLVPTVGCGCTTANRPRPPASILAAVGGLVLARASRRGRRRR
jgi:hypothetical protein